MKSKEINAWKLMIAMTATGLTLSGQAISAQTQKPELMHDPSSGKGYTSWAESHISTGKEVQLKLTKFEKSYGDADYAYISTCPGHTDIPDHVAESSTSSFCYASLHDTLDFKDYDTGFRFHYDILIPDEQDGWRSSGYWIDGGAKVPMIGERKIDCAVKLSGSTDSSAGAPFSCETSWTGADNTSQPHWNIVAKAVQVIDASKSENADKAAQLIHDNCKLTDTPNCLWTRTQNSSAFLTDRKDWQSLTNWADSCPPIEKNHLFVLNSTRNVQISWSDKVGGKIFSKVTGDVLAVKVEGGIEASYEHSITQTDSYGEGYTYTIPYKYRSALYLQHGMLEVSGDFQIITDSDRYLIKNAVFRFPLQRDVTVEGRGQPVPRGVVVHVDLPCSEPTPELGAPPPEGARIGVLAVISQHN